MVEECRYHFRGEALTAFVDGCDSERIENAWLQAERVVAVADKLAVVEAAASRCCIDDVAGRPCRRFLWVFRGLP